MATPYFIHSTVTELGLGSVFIHNVAVKIVLFKINAWSRISGSQSSASQPGMQALKAPGGLKMILTH